MSKCEMDFDLLNLIKSDEARNDAVSSSKSPKNSNSPQSSKNSTSPQNYMKPASKTGK